MKNLHLLLFVTAATMASQAGENSKNKNLRFLVDSEGISISTKGETYAALDIPKERWKRQRPHSNIKMDTSIYFPLEDAYNYENTKHNNFYNDKNYIILSPQLSESSRNWANRLGKHQKHAQSLNQERDFSSTTLEEYDVKKYISSHQKPYSDTENHNWPEQYPDAQHDHERKFKKHVGWENSNRPHNSNYFELPNKSGDFTFPNSYESGGFYNFSETPSQTSHPENFYDEIINKPSADFIFSPSTVKFTKYPSNSVQQSWITTSTGSDSFVFPGETAKNTFSTTIASNTNKHTTTSIDCERTCQVTPEFNPVCGTDYNTYSNIGRLKCARKCGKDVHFYHYGSCGKSKFVTPLH